MSWLKFHPDHNDEGHTLGKAKQKARRNWISEDFVEQEPPYQSWIAYL